MKDIVTCETYLKILYLQERINSELQTLFILHQNDSRDTLASILVNGIETIVDEINKNGYKFGRCDYDGDINFENSEQTFSDGQAMGTGIILHFHGFSVQASWEGTDKYYSGE